MSVFRRCGCRDPETGRQHGKSCPKLSNPRHGSWSFVTDVPDMDGKRHQVKRGGYPTRKAALDAMGELADRARSGRRLQRRTGRLTLGEYLQDWITGKQADGLRPKTVENYRHHIATIYTPLIGHVKLADLHVGLVEDVLRQARQDHEDRYGRKMRPTTIERARATLRSALGDARREGLVAGNPAADARLPKASRPRVAPWGPKDLGRFLDATNGDRLGSLWLLLAFTGLRRGEALALRWRDVHVEQREIVVRQQLIQVGSELLFTPPKTASGEDRLVAIPQVASASLLTHRLGQDVERSMWAETYRDSDLVFCREDGSPYPPWWVTREFRQAVQRSGVRVI
ncbi:MAG: tyrosine-type recombinase/integrase, partial [Acidimicrobiales bacterium]